eukprot:gnl/MRDRNA2_/MRDRNA2_95821_c0_seq1.p1 gnl/MRDRNA2_/MRDRNA2_95821_c0~~gnl/MRDRNA2_/MRDRNA2_95821_c0_seq1.p1  ORF type:complete len:714 (-),score=179.45 gnl/MRDRNA2_/MRDRNA2_95821_c0_seq1:80-2221(-)
MEVLHPGVPMELGRLGRHPLSPKWQDPYNRQIHREQRQAEIERQLRVDLGMPDGGDAPTSSADTSSGVTRQPSNQGTERSEQSCFKSPRDLREGSRFNTADSESRLAQRERRRLELERQMRAELGIKDDNENVSTQAAEQSAGGRASQEPRSFSARPCLSARDPPKAREAAPMSSGSDPGAGSAKSHSGPSRPPKPKPHRPLASQSPGLNPTDVSDVDIDSKRWKSALLPIWKDRHNAAHAGQEESSPSRDVPSPSHRSSAASPHGSWVRGDRPFGPSSEPVASRRTPSPVSPVSPTAKQFTSTCPSLNMPASLRASPPVSLGGTLTNFGNTNVSSGVSERSQMLEESARRLRAQSERVRVENRRARTFGPASATSPPEGLSLLRSKTEEVRGRALSSPDSKGSEENLKLDAEELSYAQRRAEEMRKRIAELDEINLLEKEKLEEEQRETERRHQMQEAFEREVQERVERELREHQERQEREEREREQREAEEHRQRKERERRRREQDAADEKEARLLEEARLRARSEAARMKWDVFEQELDSKWAEQEAEEKRRLDEYAAQRRKQYEDWDRRLNEERQRHVGAENSCKAQRFVRGAKKAAASDEAFYANKRPVPGAAKAPPPPNAYGGSGTAGYKPFAAPAAPKVDTAGLSGEELTVLRELQSVRSCSRDAQKAKVKEMLFKWHPDKNPDNSERATRVFQFVQKQKELVLGL